MRRIEGQAARCLVHPCRGALPAWAPALALALALPAAAAEPAFRHSAPITVQQNAAFVQLPLPPSAYGHSRQAGLQDMRIVDARGDRVPFALLVPRANESQPIEQQRDAVLYALPRRPVAGQPWALPVEVLVQGDRISVKRLGAGTAGGGRTTLPAAQAPSPDAPGWLIDTGDPRERPRDGPPPQTLRMAWSGPAEFSAPFDIELSDDLRNWRSAGGGQLMALASPTGPRSGPPTGPPTGPLVQPSVVLPTGAARFVRLVWAEPATAPRITGAKLVMAGQRSVALDAPTELSFTASPEPAGQAAPDDATRRALHFDLGGPLPLVQADLRIASGTRVAPVRVQGRSGVDEPWRELAQSVFYRLERGAAVSRSPPVVLQASVRYLRLVPDERAAALDPAATRLVVQAQLATLVFAAQGQAPFTLLAGSADAPPGALPATTLVPALDDERPRFGRASLGEWSEVEAVARKADAEQRQAALRPWLLWAVLLAGVAGLGFMVWRLARGRG